MTHNKSTFDGDKLLNSKCICGGGLIWKRYNQVMLEPCEHIIHCKCLNSQKNKTICPICKTSIVGSNTIAQLRSKLNQKYSKELYQKYVDMVSMANFDNIYDSKKNIFNMIDAIGITSSFPFLSGYDDGRKLCREVLSLMNSKLIVSGMNYINANSEKIFISNHTSYIDFAVIFYLFECGFLASSIIRDILFGRQIMNIVPLLIIERGKDKNTVEKMREYVKNNGSICLFPEGMITHPDTIIRFRTGAFYIGYPIHPVVIRYDPVIYDTDISKIIEKICSEPNLTIYVDVLPAEYPPFDTKKIEQIRIKMARIGNLSLSRVSNKDIKD